MSHINHQRFAYIDIVKGFAIIAVVLLHVNFTYPQYSLLNIRALLGGFLACTSFLLYWRIFHKRRKTIKSHSIHKKQI